MIREVYDNHGERGGRSNIDDKDVSSAKWHGSSDPELERQDIL